MGGRHKACPNFNQGTCVPNPGVESMPITLIESTTDQVTLDAAGETFKLATGETVDTTVAGNDALITSAADMTVFVDGTVIAGSDGIEIGGLDSSLQIGTTGTVEGESDGVRMLNDNAFFLNNGSVTGLFDQGVEMEGNNSVFINNGTIFGESDGVTNDNNFGQSFFNNGSVSSNLEGFDLSSSGSLNLVNAGSISGGLNGIRLDGTGATVLNSGSIFGGEFGIDLFSEGAMQVINSGSITSDEIALSVNGTGATVQNSGTIEGVLEGVFFQSDIAQENINTLINSGTIASNGPRAIQGSSGIENIFNTGTLNGNVALANGDDVFDGRGGTVNGSIFGQGGDDTIFGGAGDDDINGGAGNDTLYGQRGADTLAGANGNDLMFGGQGNDDMSAGGGDDVLDGGAGGDFLRGFGGDDILNGGAGNDTLNGGAGSDVFVFELNAGEDRIFGFEDGSDLIDLTAFNIASEAELEAAISTNGAIAVVDLTALGGDGQIALHGSAGLIDANDFLI
ncbi:hypothetical protein GO499_00335 [Algicella marina]|uniref:Calcium-binding protein n=2 Tax=Algicella marina TaxID=2683284 RepID=A0A6P1SST5_9RHOB|nr:hypothetical protein GO499_00335 [Algicella marina]